MRHCGRGCSRHAGTEGSAGDWIRQQAGAPPGEAQWVQDDGPTSNPGKGPLHLHSSVESWIPFLFPLGAHWALPMPHNGCKTTGPHPTLAQVLYQASTLPPLCS